MGRTDPCEPISNVLRNALQNQKNLMQISTLVSFRLERRVLTELEAAADTLPGTTFMT